MSDSPSPFATGFAARCPRCGRGRLFEGFLKVAPSCEVCGLDLRAQDSGDGPVSLIILIVGFVVVGTALVVEIRHEWPVWLHMVVWLPLATVLTLALMRPFKGLLIALQYRHRQHEFNGSG